MVHGDRDRTAVMRLIGTRVVLGCWCHCVSAAQKNSMTRVRGGERYVCVEKGVARRRNKWRDGVFYGHMYSIIMGESARALFDLTYSVGGLRACTLGGLCE